jgi:multidrug resistance efflux pump
MPNNNLANISTFENLQNNQNVSFGNSQMSILNDHNNKDMTITNIDERELIRLLAAVDALEDKSDAYEKAITQKNTTGAETIKTSAKTISDKATQKLTELENEIKHDQKQIQHAKNRLETAKRTLKL